MLNSVDLCGYVNLRVVTPYVDIDLCRNAVSYSVLRRYLYHFIKPLTVHYDVKNHIYFLLAKLSPLLS